MSPKAKASNLMRRDADIAANEARMQKWSSLLVAYIGEV
jgi:hypothetical protein